MHSPPKEADTQRHSYYREPSGAVYVDQNGVVPEDQCIGVRGYHSPTGEEGLETDNLNGSTSDQYPSAPNLWHGDHQSQPYPSFDHAPEHPNGPYEQVASDEHFQAPVYMQNPPVTSSSFPQQPTRNGSMQEGARTDDAFDPPKAFSHERGYPSAYYGQDGAMFHPWQDNGYVGHPGLDPRFHHPYYQQYHQQYYGAGDQETQGHGSLTHDSHPRHPMPPRQENFGYQGAASWPHYAPPPPHETWQAAPYNPPSHPPNFYDYNSHILAGHKYPHSGHHFSSKPINTSPVSKHQSSQSREKTKDTKQKTSRAQKDPNKPKRPLSAYNLFFREERARMIAELQTPQNGKQESGEATNGDGQPAKKKQKLTGVGFKPMAQRVASKWKALDKESLAVYEKMAAEDLRRYRQEMKEYNKSGRGEARDLPALGVAGHVHVVLDKKPSNEN
mmetsp:Transcript_8910/g.17042  ORF Transcript_8910/g.17042 Transcript_8910/m.17042 type:complete len:444 (+) Transcript_8910:316-1647(+)|eukprot:scaffold1211_cov169-Amphora_coffeaeformis.AAC.4